MDPMDTGDVLIRERERLEKKQPGLRESFGKFLKDFKRYTASIEGNPAAKQDQARPASRFLK